MMEHTDGILCKRCILQSVAIGLLVTVMAVGVHEGTHAIQLKQCGADDLTFGASPTGFYVAGYCEGVIDSDPRLEIPAYFVTFMFCGSCVIIYLLIYYFNQYKK